ncbi:hypothetical protein N7517_010285 [Penicillium concentricum]|uniref:Uncharacterized protein n=1 Tax=Penicillium concentricum TaxID=293559 RepID=A0A9W9UUY1_9EURO|nr:uncharacterized protein N7517_010285 [Penicillium concentricum]KAJ5355676.1 hypothetical protein N7517_010285 [Penicillium concentricum]
MSEASTGPRSENPLLTMCDIPAEKESDVKPITISNSPAVTSLDLEAKAMSASSSHEVHEPRNAIVSDNSSPGSSDSSDSSSESGYDASMNGSSSSSPNSLSPDSLNKTSPENNVLKTSDLLDDYSEKSPSCRHRAVWETSSQSDSDAETVILCNSAANHDLDTISTDNSGIEEPCALSGDCTQGNPDAERRDTADSASDDGSDSPSQDPSDTFSPVGPRSLSPASSRSSQAPLDIDDDEPNVSKGSHNICAYASPVQDGRRIRTSCDRNDDTGIWHVEPDGFINETKRAGGPYLCAFPVQMRKLKPNDPLNDIFEDCVLFRKIFSTLAEHNVYPLSMKLRECQHTEDLFNFMPTLIFSAIRNTFDDSWILACRQIWKHFSDAGLGQVNIEVSDPGAYTFFFRAPKKSDPIWPVHGELQRRIMAAIDSTDMTLLTAGPVGMNQDEENLLQAVVMCVKYRSNRDWRNTRDLIVHVLDEFNLPMVGVIIMKGENRRG